MCLLRERRYEHLGDQEVADFRATYGPAAALAGRRRRAAQHTPGDAGPLVEDVPTFFRTLRDFT
jgi:hypothetical protein